MSRTLRERVLEAVGPHDGQHDTPAEWCITCRVICDGVLDRVTVAVTALVAEAKAEASRRAPEFDHHNALACRYCAGPLKEEIARLKRCLLDAARFIPGDETISINAETNRTMVEAYEEQQAALRAQESS